MIHVLLFSVLSTLVFAWFSSRVWTAASAREESSGVARTAAAAAAAGVRASGSGSQLGSKKKGGHKLRRAENHRNVAVETAAGSPTLGSAKKQPRRDVFNSQVRLNSKSVVSPPSPFARCTMCTTSVFYTRVHVRSE